MTTVEGRRTDDGFAAQLREATRAEHERTEQAPFVLALMTGELDRDAYAALLGQSFLFYSVLEQAAAEQREEPVAGRFVFDSLARRAALQADLRWLLGRRWRSKVVPLPATQRYVDRLRQVCFSWPGGFVAHHYTRYLGDLSGGQIIRHRLRASYGLEHDGVRFYIFDQISKPKLFKDSYRRRLDQAPWSHGERTRIVAEVDQAFRLNRGVFDDLGAAFGLGPSA